MKIGYIFLLAGLVVAANAAQIPFSETFDGLTDGSLDDQNGWVVQAGDALVQSNTVKNGKAVDLNSSSMLHPLSSTNSVIWLTFWAKYTSLPSQNPAVTNTCASLAFYINTNGNLVVYSNATPVTLTGQIKTNIWNRFDICCDYAALQWSLRVNNSNVCTGLPLLYSANRQIDSLQLQSQSESSVYVDEIAVTDTEPVPDAIGAVNAIPYKETFEGMAVGDSILVPDNTNGWYGGINAASTVVTNLSYVWTNVLSPVQSSDHVKVLQYTDAGLTNRFATNNTPVNMTVDFMFSKRSADPAVNLLTGSQTALYVNTNGLLKVWYGLDSTGTNNAWLTYTNTPVGTADWARVTVAFDYTTDVSNNHRYFMVTLNGVGLVPPTNGYSKGAGSFNADSRGIWLLTANPALRKIQSFTAIGSGLLDDLVVTTNAVTNFFPNRPSYTLTGSVTGGNGTVSPAATNVTSGGSADFVVIAGSYYRIASLTTNGTPVVMSFDNNSISTNFTWSNVLADGAVVATFTARVAGDPAGTPYWWLAQYGLTNFYSDAQTDSDSDGLLTWQEYIAGTNPTNPASGFRVTENPRNVLNWNTVTGRVYAVYWSTNLLSGFQCLESNIPSTRSSYTNLTAVPVSCYKLDVRLQ